MKQRSLTTRKYGVFLAFLLVLSMVFGTFARVNVYADDSNTSGVSNAYDEKAKGSITVELQDIQSQEATNKNGVELTLYKVADIRTDHNYIEFALVDELKDLESLTGTDINDITTGEANREAAQKLEDAVLETGLTAEETVYTETVNGVDGVAVFQGKEDIGLDQGMYLVLQTNANAYGIISPLLVAIPYMTDGSHWIYDVTAQPKGIQFDSLGSIQVTKALKYNNNGTLLETTAEDASFDIGLFMDSQGQYRYSGDNWRQTVTIRGTSSNTVTFENLPVTSKPYYIFELDENGEAIPYSADLTNTEAGNMFTVMAGEDAQASNAGEAPEIILDTNANASATISNVYGDLPEGYYVTGRITLTKSVMDSGNMITSDDTFYAGIFTVDAQGNVADNPTDVVKLNNNGTVTVEVPLGGTSGTEQITYAVMETDKNGKLIDKATFPYTVTGEGNVTLSMDQTTGEVNIVNTLGNSEGYYQEEPSTQEPAAANPGSGNGNNSNSSSGSSGSGSSSRSSRSAKTGDNNQILLYAGLLAAAVIAGGVVVVRRRRRNG